jgi:hypothetical protein
MDETVRLFDGVALADDLPEHGLPRGQVGTVVELLGGDQCEVEFRDGRGRAYAQIEIGAGRLMVLHYRPPTPADEAALGAAEGSNAAAPLFSPKANQTRRLR